jgi:cation diffusion facilitator CzcD-associated flavoprotein CzcO
VKHLVGRNGIAMAEVWKDEQTRNYRSIAMPGFPNFFVMIGPNSPITNLSLIEVADVGANYILQCVDKIEAGEFKTMTVKKSAAAEFGQALEQGFKGTVWVTGCGGWYTYGSSLPQTWPWPAKKFREDLARPNLDHYELSD